MKDQWDCEIANYYVTLLTTFKFIHLHSSIRAFFWSGFPSIRAFFERVFRKIFWTLLGYTVAKAPASPRNSTWFTRPFLLVRGWGLGTRLGPYVRAGMDLYRRYAGFLPASKGSAMLSQSNNRSGGRRVCWTCSSAPVYCTCSSVGSTSASHPTHIAMYTQCERICT